MRHNDPTRHRLSSAKATDLGSSGLFPYEPSREATTAKNVKSIFLPVLGVLIDGWITGFLRCVTILEDQLECVSCRLSVVPYSLKH